MCSHGSLLVLAYCTETAGSIGRRIQLLPPAGSRVNAIDSPLGGNAITPYIHTAGSTPYAYIGTVYLLNVKIASVYYGFL